MVNHERGRPYDPFIDPLLTPPTMDVEETNFKKEHFQQLEGTKYSVEDVLGQDCSEIGRIGNFIKDLLR